MYISAPAHVQQACTFEVCSPNIKGAAK